MLGNTVNQYCPYFKEMGLKHISKIKPGEIDVYTYGDSGLKVAVEYTMPNKAGKASDIYFAFDNPKLHMITGGAWEMALYPHCPIKYVPADVVFTYFIIFDDTTLQCDIIMHEEHNFTFIHRKTTPLKYPDIDLIYSTEFNSLPNWRRKITRPTSNIERKIAEYYTRDKIFYADNDIGEIVRNYLVWCGKSA